MLWPQSRLGSICIMGCCSFEGCEGWFSTGADVVDVDLSVGDGCQGRGVSEDLTTAFFEAA